MIILNMYIISDLLVLFYECSICQHFGCYKCLLTACVLVLICVWFLIVYWKIDRSIAFYFSTQSYTFCHLWLHANSIVWIRLLWLAKKYLYQLVNNIVIPVACFSRSHILNGFGILLLWPCGSLLYVLLVSSLHYLYTCSVEPCLNGSQ